MNIGSFKNSNKKQVNNERTELNKNIFQLEAEEKRLRKLSIRLTLMDSLKIIFLNLTNMNFSKDCKLSVNKTEQSAFYNDKKILHHFQNC